MTTPPGANTDTTGVVGNSGPIPISSQVTSAGNKDTTEMGAGGSVTARPESPGVASTPATSATDGTSSIYAPVSTLLSSTRDTTQGFAGNVSAPVYRAPASGVPASIKDTGNALGFIAAVPTDTHSWIEDGTTETANFGAPRGLIGSVNDFLTIDQTVPVSATKQGVLGAAGTLTVVNYGHVIGVTAEAGHVIDQTTAFIATHAGVITAPAGVVVKKGAVTLTQGVDYTITGTGLLATANYSILRVAASPNVANGDAVTISYSYGNAAYHAPVPLVLTTDYTVSFTGTSGQRSFTLLRASGSSAVANGDSVAVNYNYGDLSHWATHDPTSVPPAPTIGTAVAKDRSVTVVWTHPSLTATDDVDGYVIQSSTGGSRYVPGGLLSFPYETVTPAMPYEFRVAGFNEHGLGAFSAWSNTVVPLNYDQVPPLGLDPKNTVNPIYNSDGSVVPGTGLGV